MFFICLFGAWIQAQEPKELNIIVVANYDGQQIEKNNWYHSKRNDSIQLTKVKFYLTNFRLLLTTGPLLPIEEKNLLIDGFIINKIKLNFKVPKNTKDLLLACDLGVDKKYNMSGANSGDLDPVNGMFWSWQSGYINFKIEGISPSCNTRKNKFQFHIGGYQTPHQTKRQLSFKLENWEIGNLVISIELSKFFDDLELGTENQLTTVGARASQMANQFQKIFSSHE